VRPVRAACDVIVHQLSTASTYRPHHPQGTLLHRIVRDHFATLRELSVDPDEPTSGLPEFVQHEFENSSTQCP